MAKWMSAAERERRETDAKLATLVAKNRVVADAAMDTQIAAWGDDILAWPENWTTLLAKAVQRVLSADDQQAMRDLHLGYNLECAFSDTRVKELVRRRDSARRAAENALQAQMADRAVVATCVETSRETIGAFAVVDGRVLVCVASGYVSDRDLGPESDRDSGWYTNYAEPTTDERASVDYQRLAQQVADEQARLTRITADGVARRQADLDEMNAARVARGERSLDEAMNAPDRTPNEFAAWLFAGTSDN